MHYLYDSVQNTYRSFGSRSEADLVCTGLNALHSMEVSRFVVIADGSAAAVAIDFATKMVGLPIDAAALVEELSKHQGPDELGDMVHQALQALARVFSSNGTAARAIEHRGDFGGGVSDKEAQTAVELTATDLRNALGLTGRSAQLATMALMYVYRRGHFHGSHEVPSLKERIVELEAALGRHVEREGHFPQDVPV